MRAREKRIGRTVWTPEMKEDVRKNYAWEKTERIAERLGVSRQAVVAAAYHLGVLKQNKKFIWTTEKVAYLTEHYPKGNIAEIAAHLGCSPSQLKTRAQKMGLRREKRFRSNAVSEEQKPKSVYFGNRKRIGKNTYPITHATRTLICSCALSGYTSEQTAMLTERSIEQVEEILQECKENGWFAMVKRYRETSEMTIAKDKML